MLRLDYLDAIGVIPPQDLDAMLAQHHRLPQLLEAGEARYANSLGWMDIDTWAGASTLANIDEAAARIIQDADAFVLVGVGGSNNAARAVIEALRAKNAPEIIYMGNTLSPYTLAAALKGLEGQSFYVDCIAKNFETLEPGASFRMLRTLLERQYGIEAGRRVLVTGTPGSRLEALSRENGWRFFPFPPDIGGRFSALSNVGLLPMAVAGVDIHALVDGARQMREMLRAAVPEANLALRYACLRNLLYRRGYRLEMLSAFEPRFRWFFKWWVQLFAESEGKDGKGLFPVASEYSEELHAVGQYVQAGEPILFETFLEVRTPDARLPVVPSRVEDGFGYLDGMDFGDINRAAFEATRTAHSRRLPCLGLSMETLDAKHFGALFYFFQCSCYLSGVLLGVDPFNQPGVEAYKKEMFRTLGKPQHN